MCTTDKIKGSKQSQVIDFHDFLRFIGAPTTSQAWTCNVSDIPFERAPQKLSLSLYINTHRTSIKLPENIRKHQQLNHLASISKTGLARWIKTTHKTISGSFWLGRRKRGAARTPAVDARRRTP
jgi:hypothetical protein